jgi:hypothetical protein
MQHAYIHMCVRSTPMHSLSLESYLCTRGKYACIYFICGCVFCLSRYMLLTLCYVHLHYMHCVRVANLRTHNCTSTSLIYIYVCVCVCVCACVCVHVLCSASEYIINTVIEGKNNLFAVILLLLLLLLLSRSPPYVHVTVNVNTVWQRTLFRFSMFN